MYTRENIEFKTDDIKLRGWFYTPKYQSPAPCIIMTHGFSALKEHYLDQFATRFAEAGMCVLVYDNRNFGESGGNPRLEVDPMAQIHDMKIAITFVQGLSRAVNPKKIGLWGTSFSGGIVLAVAGTDKRVSCVVTQVPFISGHHKFLMSNKPDQWETTRKKYEADRELRLNGHPPTMIPVVTDDPEKSAIMRIPSAYRFFTSVKSWPNKVTLRSVENSGEFEPIAYIEQISPTPILFLVADKDTINTTNLALKAHRLALEPKKLILIKGDHFVPYLEQFDTCVNEACKWYAKFLLDKKIVDEDAKEIANSIKAKL